MINEIEGTHKYKDLYQYFEKIFRSKHFTREDFFMQDVFFFSEDLEFIQNQKSKTPNPESNIPMHRLLKSLSIDKDPNKIKVNVHKFINTICCELIRLQTQKEKITEKIKTFNIDETLNVIEQKIFNLNNNQSLFGTNIKNESSFRISVSRLDNFPPGDYSFKLKIRKIKKNGLIDSGIIDTDNVNYTLLSNVKKESLSLVDLKDKSKDFTFPTQTVLPVDLNYNEFKSDDPIIKQFSGTNIASFELEISDKDGNVYLTNNQDVIDLYIKLVNFYTDFTQIKKEFDLKLMSQKIQPVTDESNNYCILVNVLFEIDTSVRKSVLQRIYYIFKNTIAYRTLIDTTQSDYLKYFSSFSDNIREILEKGQDEQRSNCGDCACLIF